MLCDRCKLLKLDLADAFAGGKSQIHHQSFADLTAAARGGCELCQKIRDCHPPTFKGFDDYPDKNIYWDLIPKRELEDQKAGPLNVRISQRHPSGVYQNLEIYVDQDSPAAKHILGRPIAQESHSDVCFDRAREWIAQCLEEHPESCPQFPDALLPTRVIDVGSFSEPCRPKLHVTKKGERGSWVSVSHCWGKESNIVTLEQNIDQHAKSLPMHEMPTTFRHAILATRRLGYRFLWIDSLCIVQRSPKDWARESCQMQRYYKQAALTLAADSAKGDEDGFLGPRPNASDKMISIPFRIPTAESEIKVFLRQAMELEGTPSPDPGTLASRAWGLQEDLLSPRTLHFTEMQMVWECQYHKIHESVAAAGLEDEAVHLRGIEDITKRFFLNPESRRLHPLWSTIKLDWSERWYHVVDNFTRRDVTYNSDRLPAVSAIAREIHDQLGWTYLAGLWREDFRKGLLWSDFAETTNPSAPSWSWASLEYNPAKRYHGMVYKFWPIFDGSVLPQDHVDLIDWQINPQDQDPYGRVKSGRLSLRGRWMRASKWKGYSKFHFNSEQWLEGKSHSDAGLEHPLHDQIVCTFSTTCPTTQLLRSNPILDADSELSLLQISSWDLNKEPWPNAALRGRHFRNTNGIKEVSSEDRNYIITFALLLIPAGKPGTFRRIGLCEIPRVNGFADNWEIKEISLV